MASPHPRPVTVVLTFVALVASACSTPSSASEPELLPVHDPPAGEPYGEPLTPRDPVALTSILAHPERYEGQVVRTTGTVQAVCQHRGCWMDIGGEDQADGRVHVRSLDHSIAFPRDSVGKIAEVEGEVQPMPGASGCGTATEEEDGTPGCGVAANGRLVQLAVHGAVLR